MSSKNIKGIITFLNLKTWLLILLLVTGGGHKKNFAQPANRSTEQKVFALAKTFGYIRYFNPADEAAAIDWDRFAFYASQKVITSVAVDFKKEIQDMFLPFTPGMQIHRIGEAYSTVKIPVTLPGNLKPVYWQHLGDGKGSIGYPYKSMRVNREARVLPESQNDYSGIRKALDIEALKGKEIRLTALFKADPSYNGRPAVIIGLKEKDKDAIQISSEGQGISATEWVKHTITTRLTVNIEKLSAIAQSINMAGSICISRVELEVRENGTWKNYFSADFKNMAESEFQEAWKPYGINQEIGIVNEQASAFVKIKRTNGKLQKADPLFNKAPAQDEIISKNIGSGWQLSFPIVLWGDEGQTYPVGDANKTGILLNILENLSANELVAENLYTRIANVIILWNKVQHFYPELDHLSVNWDESLREAIHACFSDTSLAAHKITLTKMLAPLKDSHMTLYTTSLMPPEYYPPVKWEWIENKMVITAVLDSNLIIRRGDVITAVNNIKANVYWKKIKQLVLGATESRKNFKAINESLSGPEGSRMEISFTNESGISRKVLLERSLSDFEYNQQLNAVNNTAVFEETATGIFYINLSKISWADLEKRIPQLVNAAGLIFDLRGYPAWQTIKVIAHLTDKPVEWYKVGLPALVYPDRKQMTFVFDSISMIEPRSPLLTAKKVFLTGGGAVSYAEDFLGIIDHYHLADIVGEPTAGTTGGTNNCYLLGGLFTPWTGVTILKQDSSRFNATKGIVPKYLVKKTISGVRTGTDECVLYALKNIFSN